MMRIKFSSYVIVVIVIFLLLRRIRFTEKTDSPISNSASKILEIYEKIRTNLNTEAFSDSSGTYKIIPINYSNKTESSFDVAYVSQCSWNKFHEIYSLLETWEGPISVAVFSEIRFMDEAIWKMSSVMYCHKVKNLVLTLVVPARDVYNLDDIFAREMSRKTKESDLCKPEKEDEYMDNYNWVTPYPVNLLRNVAKSRTTTDYILVTDIDMIPNKSIRKNFLRYISTRKTRREKIVFVIPAFEINIGVDIPQTKSELIARINEGNVRPFYIDPCRKCQLLTNYTNWFSYMNLPGTRVLYTVEWKHPWEPFYIGYRYIPNYDERFKQYGYNRVSQICQLYVEGYSFVVLDNVFLIHRGFKTKDGFHKTKELEMSMNRKIYEAFKEELKIKYPNSNRSCIY